MIWATEEEKKDETGKSGEDVSSDLAYDFGKKYKVQLSTNLGRDGNMTEWAATVPIQTEAMPIERLTIPKYPLTNA